jgi:hypothetical protein
MGEEQPAALLKLYEQICNNFRLLTDIRFKLLAFLPIATGAAVAFSRDQDLGARAAISLFGLVVTIGLIIYNTRNDQLYGELAERGAEIERALGAGNGMFGARSPPWLQIDLLGPVLQIDHQTGIRIIYAASVALWLFGFLTSALQLLLRVQSSRWLSALAIVVAVLISYRFSSSIQRQINDENQKRIDRAKYADRT